MSSKGILPQTRNGSGQIEDESEKKLSDTLGFFKNGEFSLVTSDSILPNSNQDVAEDCSIGDNIASGVLEITSPANFILSSTQVTSDVVGVSVDDWFKHKNDASMDLDSVLTSDGIEVNDLEAYQFAATKDNVDMCIVTNICDMGLGFDLPVNVCDKCHHSVDDCDCVVRAVNDFEQTSFLDDLNKSNREKSMLLKGSNSVLCEKRDLLSVKEEIADSYILHFPEKVGKGTNIKDSGWNQSDDVYDSSQSVVLNEEKVGWESLSSVSQHSTDYESEKDVDFSEFSLLTFQVDNSEGINVINTLSQIDTLSDCDGVPSNVIVSEGCILPGSVSLVESCNTVQQVIDSAVAAEKDTCKEVSTNEPVDSTVDSSSNGVDLQAEPSILVESSPATIGDTSSSASINKSVPSSHSSHPRSLLRSPQKVVLPKIDSTPSSLLENVSKTTLVRSESENGILHNSNVKKAPAMTIIAISTDKSKNTTEIVINTSQGEQKFKGKTTDFIKATSKLLNSPNVKTKVGQTLNFSNVDIVKEETIVSHTESDSDWLKYDKNKAADEQPITEALAALGIDLTSLTCVTPGGINGYKLWACPIPECNKLYPRLSLLKVHILTHYGVRPYRCDVPGCQWTFYTFFKLKRHKETHLKRKAFVCTVPGCGHRFTTIYNLKTHRKLHERPAKLQCPVVGCDAHFQTKRAVDLHIKKHGISHAPYQCTYAGCGKRYYSSNTLNSHARSHQHREEEVRCQWTGCGKWFDKPCRLKAHLRTHTGDKPYLCNFENCTWAFSSASKLKRHQQKHTNERKFLCTYEGCGKSFMRSEHLKEHMQTHIGERSYQCTVENCGVKFTAKSSLYVHLKKHKQQVNQTETTLEKQSASKVQSSNSPPTQQHQQQKQQQQQQQQQLPQRQQNQRQKTKQATSKLVIPKWESMEEGDQMQVILPVNGSAFHCPVEPCPCSYSCKASLRQHLLKHHTPVLASDASQLDYVTSLFLSGSTNQQVLVSPSDEQSVVPSDGLTTVSLQGPVCTVAVASTGDLNTTGLLSTNTLFDPVSSFNSEFINTDFLNTPQINNMCVVAHESSEEVGNCLQDGSQVGTGAILASNAATNATIQDSETELQFATESIRDPLLADDYRHQRVVAFDLSDLSSSDDEIVGDLTCQAARTHLTYMDIVSRKHLQYSNRDSSATVDSKTIGTSCDNGRATIASRNMGSSVSEPALADAIIGLRDPVAALCVSSDMAGLVAPTSDLHLLLQEESGLQVLLLDGNDSQFYTESTINLRDLE